MQSSESLTAEAVDHAAASASAAPDAVHAPRGDWSARTAWTWSALVVAFIALLLLVGLSRFGIWDPWELGTADVARKLAAGEAQPGPFSLGTWLVSCGFRVFGVHEWAGRVPIALAGVVCVLCALELGRAFADARTGVYAALIAGTTPLFFVNSRLMIGAAPYMAVQGLLGLATLRALLPSAAEKAGRTAAFGALALLLTAAAILTRGALLGALPPLLACVAVAWTGDVRTRARVAQLSLIVFGAIALVAMACVARDISRDALDYSVWLGGSSHSFAPPTFDLVIEHVFHAFAPWSALLPIALSRSWLLDPTPDDPDPTQAQARALNGVCMLWVALGYGAQTLFLSRYGHDVTYLPVVPLALMVALLLRDLERRSENAWGAALAALLLVGLLIRDFALYPSGVVQGLTISPFELPKIWNPAAALAAVLLPFAACAALGFCAGEREARLDLRAPYRLLRVQWQRGLGFRLWLIAGALLLVGMLVFGGLAYAIPRRLHMPSLAIRFVRTLLFVPLVIAGAVAAGQLLVFACSRLTSRRFLPLLIAGGACGVYFAQAYLPQLSDHFSPREVYSTYNEAAAGPGEPLAEYRVGGRAATYYAKGEVIEVTTVTQLIDHLAKDGQRWAAFPSEELAEIDRNFRNRTGRHLFVVDAKNARVVLAASQPVAKHHDDNELSKAVLKAAPAKLQHPVSVNFDERVELLGYDTELPHQTYVGAGESFTLTWYFRTLRKIPSGYRLFVHIDGDGQRIHGDHDPVQNKYPVQLWEVGDVIADEQKIDVPASTRAGEYTIFMGFYSGDTRLPIKSGPNAGEDRARVGVLRIQ